MKRDETRYITSHHVALSGNMRRKLNEIPKIETGLVTLNMR